MFAARLIARKQQRLSLIELAKIRVITSEGFDAGHETHSPSLTMPYEAAAHVIDNSHAPPHPASMEMVSSKAASR
ncbi:hypothetical protein CUU80_06670 [Bifidobacterium scaligerum]|uniref:Uncharacterized protein n=1 Tax=Bifidobacterium scaligerum TaxID=2052656 RepID=A0A2M9HQB9_9BIFI|nr:hypothetical protein CUU80_06670 [Bifidobacterium scaligerum]